MGTEHTSAFETINNPANLYADLEWLEEAINMYKQGYEITRRHLPKRQSG
jgi:hypothetical protein